MSRIKKTIICRHIDHYTIDRSCIHTYTPQRGDVGVFEVLSIGKHQTLQSAEKRMITLAEGDTFMAAFANRYATEQFEGYVPDKPTIELDVLAAGGAVGILRSKHAQFKHIPPTQVRLIGYAVDNQQRIINTVGLHTDVVPFQAEVPNQAKVILSLGSSMDSGKTTSAAYLTHGLKMAGKKVCFIKLTGTCYTKDKDLVYDLGADQVVDFTDVGYPSTYMCSKEELLNIYQSLLLQLAPYQPEFIVMEIADGLLQRETEMLLRDAVFKSTIAKVMLSCGDSLAVLYGYDWLHKQGLTPSLLSGVFTMSPLLIQEVAERLEVPVLTIESLMMPEVVQHFNQAYAI